MDYLVNLINDPDVRWLASIGETLRPDYINVEQDLLWKDSPFDWIRCLPSRRKGKVGEQLVAGWCAAKGFDVTSSGDSDADRVIAGKRASRSKCRLSGRTGATSFNNCAINNMHMSSALASRLSTPTAG